MRKIMSLETIRQRLKDAHLPDVQRKTGLAYNTLKNIRDGKSVMYHNVLYLSNYFHGVDEETQG